MKEQLLQNLRNAIAEVEEHTSQGGVQTCQLEAKDVDRVKFIKDVKTWLSYDKDLKGYYSEVDIYNEVNNYLNN